MAKRITPEEFRERAREWLVRMTGWVSAGRDVSLGKELEKAYEEGREERQERETERDGTDPVPPERPSPVAQ